MNEILIKHFKNEPYRESSDNIGINFLILSTSSDINGKQLAKSLKILTNIESKEGGPYYSSYDRKEIDLDTNIMIGYFLSLFEVTLDSIDNMIKESIENNNLESKIFESNYFLMYFISLFYKNKSFLGYLLGQKPNNTRDKILLVYSLYNIGFNREALIEKLENINNIESELDALIINKLKSELYDNNEEDKEEKKITSIIMSKIDKRLSDLPNDMKDLAKIAIDKTTDGNPDKQMSLISYYTKKSLKQNISDDFIAQLGVANIFYWTAFIIYDDFWDEDEDANPQLLPIANFLSRNYIDFFSSVMTNKTFFRELMDRLNIANSWETIHCRTKIENNVFYIPDHLPNYGNYDKKYEPASGHILGPVIIFERLGYDTEDLISYFKHYLISMQINDDAHDWEEDMERGHLSTVVVILINDWLEKYPNRKTIDLIEDKEKLQQIFWLSTLKKICRITLKHTDLSREYLNKIKALNDISPLEQFINRTENIAKKALDEQEKSIDFLNNFSSS